MDELATYWLGFGYSSRRVHEVIRGGFSCHHTSSGFLWCSLSTARACKFLFLTEEEPGARQRGKCEQVARRCTFLTGAGKRETFEDSVSFAGKRKQQLVDRMSEDILERTLKAESGG